MLSGRQGRTPVHWALYKDNVMTAEWLIRSKVRSSALLPALLDGTSMTH
jgi:hypothetical protein